MNTGNFEIGGLSAPCNKAEDYSDGIRPPWTLDTCSKGVVHGQRLSERRDNVISEYTERLKDE